MGKPSETAGKRQPPSPATKRTLAVRVALPLPLPQAFDYSAPVGVPALAPGQRVRVPFGTGERIGIVIDITPVDERRAGLKPVQAVLDAAPLFDPELWRSLNFAARYYHHPLGEVLHAALPTALRRGEVVPDGAEPGLAVTHDGLEALRGTRLRAGPGRQVLDCLQPGPLPITQVREQVGDAALAAIRRLRQRGWIEDVRLSTSNRPGPALAGPPLNVDQRSAIETIDAARPGFRTVLLEGVTGSGKTEVYLELIARVLASERQALVLVPEIALTPQALKRYRERLSVPVLGLHSGLTDRERARAWARARSGEPCVVLGTRSAVFTPLPRAGLIVIDEEHDGSYKQGDGFRYHARDLALVRAKALAVPIVLGSATPSLETLALVEAGRAQRLALPARASALARPPTLRLLDVRRQRLIGGLCSDALEAIEATLTRGEQVLVFRNRRGYAPLLTCPSCGWHSECPRCDRAMTVHLQIGALLCHHCGLRRPLPLRCPECDHDSLDSRGVGTERIESDLVRHFTDRRVLRIDRDSIRGTGQLDAVLADIDQGQPAILIGTQLLAKGHDWPALTLVVVVDADHGLFSADFRAPERLAQLLTQVAGRAGRGDRPGSVLIQTRQPEHAFWLRWLGGGHAAVATAELAERKASALPPFRHQALLAAEAQQRERLNEFFDAALALPGARADGVEQLGPMPAPMPRRAGHHRAQLLLEADARTPLHGLLDAWLPLIYTLPTARRVRWSLDVDPQGF